MQPLEQALFTAAPRSWLLHSTTGLAAMVRMLITCLGQAAAQAPQPTHLLTSTLALPSTTEMAPNLQAFTQSPKPRQAKLQALGPPNRAAAAEQL